MCILQHVYFCLPIVRGCVVQFILDVAINMAYIGGASASLRFLTELEKFADGDVLLTVNNINDMWSNMFGKFFNFN